MWFLFELTRIIASIMLLWLIFTDRSHWAVGPLLLAVIIGLIISVLHWETEERRHGHR